MPIVIGGKLESDFTDPIGMLGDCHQRIIRFLQVLVTLATQHKGDVLPDEQRALLATGLRYFRESAPKHTADEEQSLFPRLRGREGAEIDAMLARIDLLEQEHKSADQIYVEVNRLGELWLSNGQLSPDEAEQFERLTRQLDILYHRHIKAEDTEVFPLAARVLSPRDRQVIGHEMAARRRIGTALAR